MNKEEVMQELQNNLKNAESRLEAWKNVKRLSKKDGSDFSIFSKNISNAKIGVYSFVEDYNHPYLTIFYKTANGKREEDNLPIFIYRDEMKKDDSRNKDFKGNTSRVRDTYRLTLEEIFETIEDYKKKFEILIEKDKKQLSIAETYLQKADEIIEKTKDLLKSDGLKDGYFQNSLGYAIKGYIIKNIK